MSMRAPLSFNTIFRQVRGTPLMQTRRPRDPPPPSSTTASPSTVVHGPNQTGSQIFEPFFSVLKLQWQTPRHCSDLRCRWGGARATGWGRPSPMWTGPCPVSCPEKSLPSILATTVSSCRPNLIKHSFKRVGDSEDPQEWSHRPDPDLGTALLLSPRWQCFSWLLIWGKKLFFPLQCKDINVTEKLYFRSHLKNN
jgi:hypothetical protein